MPCSAPVGEIDPAADDFATSVWPGEAELEVELTDALPEGLSLTAARPRDRRAVLARAGERIVSADPRYVRVDVARASGEENCRLRAVRREDTADELASAVD